ncbi:MAG: hypothetical protein LH629_00025 [Ignavibacteria bacterium]|nr:hypothetical protein [Ignavibacteria bacterium]
METYKIRTKIKENHKILIENLPFEKGEEVEITITQKTDISTEDIMKLQDKSSAFDFQNDEREDIYTVKDLKV